MYCNLSPLRPRRGAKNCDEADSRTEVWAFFRTLNNRLLRSFLGVDSWAEAGTQQPRVRSGMRIPVLVHKTHAQLRGVQKRGGESNSPRRTVQGDDARFCRSEGDSFETSRGLYFLAAEPMLGGRTECNCSNTWFSERRRRGMLVGQSRQTSKSELASMMGAHCNAHWDSGLRGFNT